MDIATLSSVLGRNEKELKHRQAYHIIYNFTGNRIILEIVISSENETRVYGACRNALAKNWNASWCRTSFAKKWLDTVRVIQNTCHIYIYADNIVEAEAKAANIYNQYFKENILVVPSESDHDTIYVYKGETRLEMRHQHELKISYFGTKYPPGWYIICEDKPGPYDKATAIEKAKQILINGSIDE